MKITENTSLLPFNTFGMDVPVRWLVEISETSDLPEAIAFAREKQLPLFVLGGGSNILATRPLNAVVLQVNLLGISTRDLNEDRILLRAAAGEVWHHLVLHTVEQGWGGMENLSLIPGKVGAAPIQNIGAYGVEVKDFLHEVEAFDLQTGESRTFTNEDCRFGYRESVFKRELAGRFIITAVSFILQKHPVLNTRYGAIESELALTGKTEFTVKDVSEAVIRIRRSKLPDPEVIGNAGSFFKNPEVVQARFDELKNKYATMPGFTASPGNMKIPAAWLIEQCGWKGRRFGNYGVHEFQPLVLVNYGGAKGSDIYELSGQIVQSVEQQFGITLEREVNIL